MAKEYVFKLDYALYNEETGEAVFKPKVVCELVRCGKCKHRGFHRVFNCRGDVMTDFPENSKCPMRAALLIMPDDFYCKYGERKDANE